MAEPSEEYAVLLAQARRGDRDALDRLTRLYEPELRIVARVQLGPALRPYLDSVDLVQSVHRSLLLGVQRLKLRVETPQQLLALALLMVKRKVARHWRRHRRQDRLSGRPAPDRHEEVTDLITALSCPDPDPARAAQVRDAVGHLWAHLDATERQLIELRLLGHNTAEVARELGLDADGLRVRLSRLRVRLQANGVLSEWL
jgi:RNA polymerase sigma-70 factor (ECF subfamily)